MNEFFQLFIAILTGFLCFGTLALIAVFGFFVDTDDWNHPKS